MVKAAPRIVLRTRAAERFPSDALRIDQGAKVGWRWRCVRAAQTGSRWQR